MSSSDTVQPETKASVCVVIPVCNEEASLPSLTHKLGALHTSLATRYRLSYCFVDDGSTDGTAAMLTAAAPDPESVTVLTHAHCRGVGAAFRTAFSIVDADIVCTMDADCSYEPALLASLIAEIETGRAEAAVASPYHPQGRVEGVERWRLLLSRQCSSLYRLATPLHLYTYTSICRAYSGLLVPRLTFPSDGFVAAVEILLSAAGQGSRVVEIPAVLQRRAHGFSKMRILRTIRAHVQLLAECCTVRGFPPRCLPVEVHKQYSYPPSLLKTAPRAIQPFQNKTVLDEPVALNAANVNASANVTRSSR